MYIMAPDRAPAFQMDVVSTKIVEIKKGKGATWLSLREIPGHCRMMLLLTFPGPNLRAWP